MIEFKDTGIALAVYNKQGKLEISATSLKAEEEDKRSIIIQKHETISVSSQMRRMRRDIEAVIDRLHKKGGFLGTCVLGRHVQQNIPDPILDEIESVILSRTMRNRLHHRVFGKIEDFGDVNQPQTIVQGAKEIEISDEEIHGLAQSFIEHRISVEAQAKTNKTKFMSMGGDPESPHIRILKERGPKLDLFGRIVCAAYRNGNLCVKPQGWDKNPYFADVAATYMADWIDARKRTPPTIVWASKKS